MLQFFDNLDTDNKVYYYLRNWIAYNSDDQSYIYKLSGRHRTGRKTRYILHLSDNGYIKILAFTDIEAYNMAIKKLKMFEKG